MRGVVGDQLRGRDESLGMDRLERINQTSALLGDALERIAIRVARRDPLRSSLEERARHATDLRVGPTCLEEKRRHAGHEGRRHGRAGEHGERTERNREGRQDIATRRSDRGLEEQIVRGAVAGEARDETAIGVLELHAGARLREGDGNRSARGDRFDELEETTSAQKHRRSENRTDRFTVCGLDQDSSEAANADSCETIAVAGDDHERRLPSRYVARLTRRSR